MERAERQGYKQTDSQTVSPTGRQTDRQGVCSVSGCRQTVTALFCQTDSMLFGASGTEDHGGECSGVSGEGEM